MRSKIELDQIKNQTRSDKKPVTKYIQTRSELIDTRKIRPYRKMKRTVLMKFVSNTISYITVCDIVPSFPANNLYLSFLVK